MRLGAKCPTMVRPDSTYVGEITQNPFKVLARVERNMIY